MGVSFPATPTLSDEERGGVGTRVKPNVAFLPTVADVEIAPSPAEFFVHVYIFRNTAMGECPPLRRRPLGIGSAAMAEVYPDNFA